jgi:transcriptional regulator with XRE-family HTH domain
MAKSATMRKPAATPRKPHLKVVPSHNENRIQSQTHTEEALSTPQTIPERLCARRTELGLSHGDIAARITLRLKDGTEFRCARNTYSNYETGKAELKLYVIEQIAKYLQVTPEWLAFGTPKAAVVPQYRFMVSKDSFEPVNQCSFNSEWFQSRYEMDVSETVLVELEDDAATAKRGDMVVVKRNSIPGALGAEYVYATGNARHKEMRVGFLERPARSSMLRLYAKDRTNFDEIPITKVILLGQVVGRMGLN